MEVFGVLWAEVLSPCADALKIGATLAVIFAYAMLAFCWLADQVIHVSRKDTHA